MSKCYVEDVSEIFESINKALVSSKQKAIKKGDWHAILSTFTPNTVRPHWVNECYRKSPFDALNAEIVKTAIEEHLSSLQLSREVSLTSSGN